MQPSARRVQQQAAGTRVMDPLPALVPALVSVLRLVLGLRLLVLVLPVVEVVVALVVVVLVPVLMLVPVVAVVTSGRLKAVAPVASRQHQHTRRRGSALERRCTTLQWC